MRNPRLPVALVLIAAVAAGVVWGPDLVVRLAIVHDHPYALDRFYRQDADWHACPNGPNGPDGTRCADVTVPADYDHPDGRTKTLALTRRPATDTDHRVGTLLVDAGGLGKVVDAAPTVAARHDLVGVPPRTSAQDLDVARSVLLEERISYLGWSDGGNLGARYAELYPRHVHRVVLDNVTNSPSSDTPVLLVGGAPDLHRRLTRSRLITSPDPYLYGGNRCVDDLVDQYLLNGPLPATDQACPR